MHARLTLECTEPWCSENLQRVQIRKCLSLADWGRKQMEEVEAFQKEPEKSSCQMPAAAGPGPMFTLLSGKNGDCSGPHRPRGDQRSPSSNRWLTVGSGQRLHQEPALDQ